MAIPLGARQTLNDFEFRYLRRLAGSVSGTREVRGELTAGEAESLVSRGLVAIEGGRAFITGAGVVAVEGHVGRVADVQVSAPAEANVAIGPMIEAEEPGADFSHDGGEAHPMRVMRLTLLEFEILTELGVEPMRVDHVPVTVVEAIARLLLKELVSQEEQRITITERGRRLLGVPPLSQTSYTVAFDFRALRW